MSPLVCVEGVRRTYRQGKLLVSALCDVSFHVEKGEFIAVVGRSGSGKSTLLNVLGALDRPDSGRVWIEGVDVVAMTERERVRLRRTRLGFVFQDRNVLPALSVLENVALPLRYAGISRLIRRRQALEILGEVGLHGRAEALPEELSGGEQQRVALARALVTKPAIVLADEPTGELDSETADALVALALRVNREMGTTFLVVTHDHSLARCAGRVFRMVDGCLTEAGGRPGNLFHAD